MQIRIQGAGQKSDNLGFEWPLQKNDLLLSKVDQALLVGMLCPAHLDTKCNFFEKEQMEKL